MPTWLVIVFTVIFKAIIENVSPQIREKITAFVVDLEKKAKETPNVFDDMLVDLLKRILAIE